YNKYRTAYLQTEEEWALWDFTKVNLPEYTGGIFNAAITGAWETENSFIYRLEFDRRITQMCGLPIFYAEQSGQNLEIKWFGKKENRLPEAFWLKFPKCGEGWEIHKMGQWIFPQECLGSPLISAIDTGIKNARCEITSLDAALVAPFGRNLLRYHFDVEEQNLYFNLYNNIWNTNFPMWYSDDAKFRFVIKNNTP
ncbi:MAG: hypothetical protein LBH54_04565, partial [Clostridiales bacterium]|nr:hypothetical protein [Clostridiales bacterium]